MCNCYVVRLVCINCTSIQTSVIVEVAPTYVNWFHVGDMKSATYIASRVFTKHTLAETNVQLHKLAKSGTDRKCRSRSSQPLISKKPCVCECNGGDSQWDRFRDNCDRTGFRALVVGYVALAERDLVVTG